MEKENSAFEYVVVQSYHFKSLYGNEVLSVAEIAGDFITLQVFDSTCGGDNVPVLITYTFDSEDDFERYVSPFREGWCDLFRQNAIIQFRKDQFTHAHRMYAPLSELVRFFGLDLDKLFSTVHLKIEKRPYFVYPRVSRVHDDRRVIAVLNFISILRSFPSN